MKILSALLAITVLSFATPALANMKTLGNFKATYPNSASIAKCTLCHDGVPKLNYYGLDLQKAALDFKAIEQLDSDGDGVSNIDEINGLKQPGVKN